MAEQQNNELCTILEGSVKVTDGNGKINEFKAGDSFVISYGTESTWTVEDSVKKIFVVSKGLD